MGLYILYGIGVLGFLLAVRWVIAEVRDVAVHTMAGRIRALAFAITETDPESLTTPAARLEAFEKMLSFEELCAKDWALSLEVHTFISRILLGTRSRALAIFYGMRYAKTEVLSGGDRSAWMRGQHDIESRYAKRAEKQLAQWRIPARVNLSSHKEFIEEMGMIEQEIVRLAPTEHWISIVTGMVWIRRRRFGLV